MSLNPHPQMLSCRPYLLLLVGLFTLFLSGCSLLPDEIDPTEDWSASKLYSEAKLNMQEEDYTTAIELYDKLMARFPFGRFAQQAQIDIAYCHYKDQEPDAALASLDRFIKTNPKHPHVDYAYYMKGLVNFNRGRGLIERWLPQDPSERDPGAARESFYDFEELAKRFPQSKYSADARQRMLFLRNNLGQYEVNVASYYMKREAYLAAANRAQYAIERFQGTPAMYEAIGILYLAYTKLGLDDLAADARRVMELNYPDHPFLKGKDIEEECTLWLFCT